MAGHSSAALTFRNGVRAGVPVLIGYFPIALTFGMLSAEIVPLRHAVSLSVFVFAGASQFVALRLLAVQARAVELVVVTFLMNFRHFIMSSAMSHRLERRGGKWSPFIAFGLTDETFAVAATTELKPTVQYLAGLELVAYSSWVAGTALGYLGGAFIPPTLQAGMGIALYALFTALLVPHMRKSVRTAFVAGSAAVVCAVLHLVFGLQIGWSIVIGILAPSAVGAFFFTEEEEE